MTLEQQQKYFQYFTEEMKGIMMRKGDDYAASSDRLSNFKMAGPIAGMTAEQNCLSLMATKVARLGQLISSNKGPRNESVHDSLIDLANYTVLLAMLIDEDRPSVLLDLNALQGMGMTPQEMVEIAQSQGIVMDNPIVPADQLSQLNERIDTSKLRKRI
jgi:hypothetical protein